MDERTKLERIEAELREVCAEVDRESAGYGAKQYKQLHRLCDLMDRYGEATREEMSRLRGEVDEQIAEQRQRIAEQREELLDLGARQFMDHMEVELDLERWDGRYAAHVAHDLEGVEETLIAAIETAARGEDVTPLLFKAHMGVCDILADMAIDDEDEEE